MHFKIKPKHVLALVAIALWMGLSATALWYYQMRWQNAFANEQQLAFFNGDAFSERLGKASQPGQITVVHLGRADCPCNRFNQPHREQIIAHYQPLGVAFTELTLGYADLATPAVAIVDADGKLAYFGPYSDSLLCSVGEGLVEPLLDQMLSGEHPEVVHTTGVGCFCPPPVAAQEP